MHVVDLLYQLPYYIRDNIHPAALILLLASAKLLFIFAPCKRTCILIDGSIQTILLMIMILPLCYAKLQYLKDKEEKLVYLYAACTVIVCTDSKLHSKHATHIIYYIGTLFSSLLVSVIPYIAGNFGGKLNLALWRSTNLPPN